MQNGVLVGKLAALEEALAELRSLGTVSVAQLGGDWRTRRAIERDLQVAVEVVIDVCQRIVALRGQAPAPTSSQAVGRCVQLGVLSARDAYAKMVQFRNLVVHRYEHIDVEILADIVNTRLADFDAFREDVMGYIRRADQA
jgi:uncharacterized protein YutE (UPF0331/DUF86 family)